MLSVVISLNHRVSVCDLNIYMSYWVYLYPLNNLVLVDMSYLWPASRVLTSLFMLQYFGGTNFGRTAGGPLQITSYDYDAPIDEYGT